MAKTKKKGTGKKPVNKLALARIEYLYKVANMLVDTYIKEEREHKRTAQSSEMPIATAEPKEATETANEEEQTSYIPVALILSRFYLQSMKEVGKKTVTRLYTHPCHDKTDLA